MDAVFSQERPVATAAVHQLGRHFPPQLGVGFFDDARQPSASEAMA